MRVALASLLLTLLGCGGSFAQSPSANPDDRTPQRLTVVCLRYVAGTQPLQVTDHFAALTLADIASLEKYVPLGTVTVWSVGVHEQGPAAKAILLLTGPFAREVTVAQPWRSTAIYLQQGQEVIVLSKDAVLCDRRISLEQQTDNQRYTTYQADLSTGGRQGGNAGAW